MSWLDDSQKSNMSLLRFLQSLAVAFVNKKVSSAKNRYERRTPVLKFIGWISLSWTASFSLMDNLSKQRINKYGDRGSPCRMPRLGTTSERGALFRRIWKRVEEIIFIMRVMRFGATWKNSSVSWIKDHSRRSYAFSRSNLSTTYLVRALREISVRITYWTMMILSLVRRPGTNPAWQGLMTSAM